MSASLRRLRGLEPAQFGRDGSPGPLVPESVTSAAEEAVRADQAKADLSACSAVIFDFLQSKGLFAAERALRTELQMTMRDGSARTVVSRNLWHSRLEKLLHMRLPQRSEGEGSPELATLLSQVGRLGRSNEPSSRGLTPTQWERHVQPGDSAGASCRSTPSRRLGVRLHQLHPSMGEEEGMQLRRQRSRSAQQSCVVFREGLAMSDEQAKSIERLVRAASTRAGAGRARARTEWPAPARARPGPARTCPRAAPARASLVCACDSLLGARVSLRACLAARVSHCARVSRRRRCCRCCTTRTCADWRTRRSSTSMSRRSSPAATVWLR